MIKMVAITHQTFGITFGLGAILLLQLFGIYPSGVEETIIYFSLVLLGSLLPDLDTPRSKLGRKLWPIAFIISIFVKHGTATHSLLFVVGVIVTSGLIFGMLQLSWFYTLGIGLGTLSHVVGDWLTKSGVPLLYPFRTERFKAPVTFRTSSLREGLVCLSLFVVNILLFATLLKTPYKPFFSLFNT